MNALSFSPQSLSNPQTFSTQIKNRIQNSDLHQSVQFQGDRDWPMMASRPVRPKETHRQQLSKFFMSMALVLGVGGGTKFLLTNPSAQLEQNQPQVVAVQEAPPVKVTPVASEPAPSNPVPFHLLPIDTNYPFHKTYPGCFFNDNPSHYRADFNTWDDMGMGTLR